MDGLLSGIRYPWLLVLAFVISIPIFWQCWKWFFGDLKSFRDDVSGALVPSFLTVVWGSFYQAEWAELKIFFLLLICSLEIAAVYKLILIIWY